MNSVGIFLGRNEIRGIAKAYHNSQFSIFNSQLRENPTLLLSFKKLHQSPTHRAQSKLLGVNVLRLNPHTLCSIVVGGEHRLILDVTLVEHVERRQFDTTITIDVGQREEVAHGSDI